MFNRFFNLLHLGEDNNLSDLLVFTTGLDAILLLGIKPSPTLQFDHPEDGVDDHSRGVPFANMCANSLHVSILADYELFKQRMLLALEAGLTFTVNA